MDTEPNTRVYHGMMNKIVFFSILLDCYFLKGEFE